VSFDILPPAKSIYAFRQGFYTADPVLTAEQLAFSIVVVNVATVDVELFQVTADEFEHSPWGSSAKFRWDYQSKSAECVTIGKRLGKRTLHTHCIEDQPSILDIALADALADREHAVGHVLVVVTSSETFDNNQQPFITAWVQATKLAFQVITDTPDTAYVIADSLLSGQPIAGATMQAADGSQLVSDDNGIIKLTKPPKSSVLRSGHDAVVMPTHIVSPHQQRSDARALFHVIDDRKLYKPNERVHIKGWVRIVQPQQAFHRVELPSGKHQVKYSVRDARGVVFSEGSADVQNTWGSFDFSFDVPDTINLGNAYMDIRYHNYSHSHTIQLQEFRRPEFSASAQAESATHVTNSAPAVVELSAQYFAGGAIENAQVSWSVTSSSGTYSPPGWAKYRFGKYTPWYYCWRSTTDPDNHYAMTRTLVGSTDSNGKHRVAIASTGSDEFPVPVSLVASAHVLDTNRQTQTVTANLLVHPCTLYVGVQSTSTILYPEGPLPVSLVVSDIDGNAVSNVEMSLTLSRTERSWRKGKWHNDIVVERHLSVTSANEPIELDPMALSPISGGEYQLHVSIVDQHGNRNATQMTLWISGGNLLNSQGGTQVTQERVLLIADKQHYQPGDTAAIVVQPPFVPCEGTYTIRCNSITDIQRFTITGIDGENTTTINVPIVQDFIPACALHVSVVGATKRCDNLGKPLHDDAPLRPAFAVGQLDISVPPLVHNLVVQATPEHRTTTPGSATSVSVNVQDNQGNAVRGAEVAVIVVDDAVCQAMPLLLGLLLLLLIGVTPYTNAIVNTCVHRCFH
jgi:alpha-2-macroglobulin